ALTMAAVTYKQFVKLLVQGLASGFQTRGQLGQQERGHRGILVANVIAGQEAIRFLRAENKILWPAEIHLAANIFEAHQQIACRLHAVAVGNSPHQLRGDSVFTRYNAGWSVPAAFRAASNDSVSSEPIWLP